VILFWRRVEPFCQTFWDARGSTGGQPRFVLKDLFANTALIAVGLAWIFVAYPLLRHSIDHLGLPVWLFIVGGSFIGAGVLAPFRMASIGAILGTIVQLLLINSAHVFGWPRF
jgi:hypothetical protein